MKLLWYRLVIFLAFLMCATGLLAQPGVENPDPGGGGGGGGGCNECKQTVWQSGVVIKYCGTPASGAWGARNCTTEYYPEGSYCYVYGDACCVD